MTSVTNTLPNRQRNKLNENILTFCNFQLTKITNPINVDGRIMFASLNSSAAKIAHDFFFCYVFSILLFRLYRRANSSNFQLFELYTFSMVFNLVCSYNTQYKVYFIQFNDLKVPKTLVPPATQLHSVLAFLFRFPILQQLTYLSILHCSFDLRFNGTSSYNFF